MTHEETRPRGVGAGSEGLGGPSKVSLPIDPVIAPFLASEVCECREAQLLRMLADGTLPLPMTGSFRTLAGVVRAAAIRKLRAMSHDLAEGAPAPSGLSYADLERRRAEVVIPEWARSGNAKLARRREAS